MSPKMTGKWTHAQGPATQCRTIGPLTSAVYVIKFWSKCRIPYHFEALPLESLDTWIWLSDSCLTCPPRWPRGRGVGAWGYSLVSAIWVGVTTRVSFFSHFSLTVQGQGLENWVAHPMKNSEECPPCLSTKHAWFSRHSGKCLNLI